MNVLTQSVLFLRWPVTLGLLAALLYLVIEDRRNSPQPSPSDATLAESYGPVSYADAVSRASRGVVSIYTRKQVEQRRSNPLADDPVFRHFFNRFDPPRQRRMQASLGSGVVVSNAGHILTNYHVIVGADEIVVALEDGRNGRAEVLGENRERDLAVLKIDLDGVQPLEIADHKPRVGDVVLAIGNPYGVGQTVTQGVISATQDRNLNLNISRFENFIQTDAAIHPGSSGGALIDAYGRLLGINTANLPQSGVGGGGIGFAVPIGIAMRTLEDIVQFGRVVRGWLGVDAREINPEALRRAGLGQAGPMVMITGITAGSPADAAGLRPGDIIIGLAGAPLRSSADIEVLVKESRPGEAVTIDFIRENEVDSVEVILQEQPLASN